MVERKVFKTKLCVLYRKGRCSRHNCSFAHGNADLRQSFASHNGNRDRRGGDLRLQLDRRHSPRHKYSSRRDARDWHTFHGSSPSKSFQKYGDKKRKGEQFDGQSNYSGSLRSSDGIGDQVKRRKSVSTNSRIVLKEQIREAQSDINILEQQKSDLWTLVKEKDEEADVLTSRIQELDAQLSKEKEECKRIISKIKKFVKAHKRHARAQEELKRSQDRLKRIGDQLSSGTNIDGGNEEDLNINIVSDGIPASHGINLKNGPLNNSFPVENSVQAKHDHAEGLMKGTSSLQNASGSKKATMMAYNENDKHQAARDEVKQKKGTSVSASISSSNKIKGAGLGVGAPATSMAARAIDELFDIEEDENVETEIDNGNSAYEGRKQPFLLPPLPPSLQTRYSQYEGKDEKVDVEGGEEEMVDVDIL